MNGKASRKGKEFENSIAEVLEELGYEKVIDKGKFTKPHKSTEEFVKDLKSSFSGAIYIEQVQIAINVYSQDGTNFTVCDFLIYHPDVFPEGLAIEAKYQEVGGTVDEKFPFLVKNIERHPCQCIVVMDGAGFREGARHWLKKEVNNVSRLEDVVEFPNLKSWIENR